MGAEVTIWVGNFFTFVAALVLLVLILYQASEWVVSFKERLCREAEALAIRRVGRDLVHDSRWFSESADARVAIELLGQRLCQEEYYGIDAVREEWRLYRAAEKPEAKQPKCPEGVDPRFFAIEMRNQAALDSA
jgi:hypothetical protein